MARVFLAEQVSLDREVALKVMANELIFEDQTFCERFLIEGKIIAKLHHHNIVTIHDIACTPDNIYYMAMEYCPGGTLKEAIKDGIAVPSALAIVRQIAAALGYAHERGFVHRDIKPGNVLFRDNGEAVLSDFGIAKTMDARTRLTQSGLAVGTPEYMSPEQATGGQLSPASDLYSLGVVLYEMLLADKPFRGPDAVSTAMMHVQQPVPRLPSRFAGLQHIIDGLMAKSPGERFSSASLLIDELDLLEAAHPSEPPKDATRVLPVDTKARTATGRSLDGGMSRRGGRRLWAVAAIAAVFIVSGLSVAALWPWEQSGGSKKPAPDAISWQAESSTPPPAQVSGLDPQARREKVDFYLEVARAHMAVGREREPVGSNALEAYQLVLQLDPQNQEASEAIERIQASTGLESNSIR